MIQGMNTFFEIPNLNFPYPKLSSILEFFFT